MIDPESILDVCARVEAGCTVGPRTIVRQFASLSRGAVIGADCTIGPGAAIDGSFIGDRTKVLHNVAMGPGFLVGQDVFLGPNVVLCNDAWPVAHSDGFDLEALLQGRIVAIRIEDGASIGANATILTGVTVGARAVVAAGAVVDRDVPAGMLWKRDSTIVHYPERITRVRMRGIS